MRKRPGLRGLALMMSILLIGVTSMPAKTKEPSPWEKFLNSVRHAFSEPEHKPVHRSTHKKTDEPTSSPTEASNTPAATGDAGAPPSERNTRVATQAASKKGDDLRYGTPVAGKKGFVTSPFSPDAGYIDVRGFAPGTPVKDPYTGKVFLTP
ncbi:MAG: hypothetical protein M3O72_02185 [Verrucomicrobiota bacterium]|nr:hypothetical protein [Verrucomicrobiota bacterium]